MVAAMKESPIPTKPKTSPKPSRLGASESAPAPLLVDAETLAARYGVSPKTIRKWGQDGTFPYVKISRRCVRYPVADCDRIIAARRVNAVSEIES